MGVITETDDDVVNEQGTTHKNQLFSFLHARTNDSIKFFDNISISKYRISSSGEFS